jgi:hypothetical protein
VHVGFIARQSRQSSGKGSRTYYPNISPADKSANYVYNAEMDSHDSGFPHPKIEAELKEAQSITDWKSGQKANGSIHEPT